MPSRLQAVLPLYYRSRSLVLQTEKAGLRPPKRLLTELRAQEKMVGNELRPLHQLFFQRFDDVQIERLLRAMPFLKLSQGRWVFGSESLAEAWPDNHGERAFILLYGGVALYSDVSGVVPHGRHSKIGPGKIFGESHFRICDETTQDIVAGSAYCEEPCIIGCLSTRVLESAFADRAFGNKRIAQLVRHVPSLKRITQADEVEQQKEAEQTGGKSRTSNAGITEVVEVSNAIQFALRDLSKMATTLNVRPGQEVLADDPGGLDDCLLVIAKGGLEVRGNVTLEEKLDALPPKKVRIRISVIKAENLIGDTWLEKLDPYCMVTMGQAKKFQTAVIYGGGPNPKFDHHGVLMYQDEEMLDFTVMKRDKFSADQLCGVAQLSLADLPNGWSGMIYLTKPKSGMSRTEEMMEEAAGRLYVTVRYDLEKVNALMKAPMKREWKDQELFFLNEKSCWGHEPLMLGNLFKRILEQASNNFSYSLTFGKFKVVGASKRGASEMAIVWKVSKQRFLDFTKHCGREKQFVQACRVSALEKQTQVKELLNRLIKRWEQEEQMTYLRSGAFMKGNQVQESMDPSRFKRTFKGVKAHISVRNALNLSGGGWWDKMDTYAIVKFRGASAKNEFRTSVLADAGSDPVWDNEGALVYEGENTLDISVWDYDSGGKDDQIGVGVLQVEQFCNGGFEGMVPLTVPGKKKKTSLKPMMIIIGIQWDVPKGLNSTVGTMATTA